MVRVLRVTNSKQQERHTEQDVDCNRAMKVYRVELRIIQNNLKRVPNTEHGVELLREKLVPPMLMA